MLWWDLRRIRSNSEYARIKAAERLGRYKDLRAVQALLKALTSDDGLLRAAAAESLGCAGGPDAIPALTASLADWDYAGKRAEAALNQIDPHWTATEAARSAVPVLIQALEKTYDFSMRERIITALGKIGDARALEPVWNVYLSCVRHEELNHVDHYQNIRVAAKEALDRIDNGWRTSKVVQDAIGTLVATSAHRYGLNRQKAMEALDEIGPYWKELDVADNTIIPLVEAVLTGGDLGDGVAMLAEINTKSRSSAVRKAALARLLEALRSEKDIPGRSAEFVRRSAVWMLGEFGEEAAEYLVHAATGDSSPMVRGSAVAVLRKWGLPQHKEVLIRCLKDSAENVRNEALEALKAIASAAEVEALIQVKTEAAGKSLDDTQQPTTALTHAQQVKKRSVEFGKGTTILQFPPGWEKQYENHLKLIAHLQALAVYPRVKVFGLKARAPHAESSRMIILTGSVSELQHLDKVYYKKEAEDFIAREHKNNWDAIEPKSSVGNIPKPGYGLDLSGFEAKILSVHRDYEVEQVLDSESGPAPAPQVLAQDLANIRNYWRHLGKEWWNSQDLSQQQAICDSCNEYISRDLGFLYGSYLLCEKCCDQRLDALDQLREDPNYFGAGVLEKARAFGFSPQQQFQNIAANKLPAKVSVVIFREGGDQPPEPEQYFRAVVEHVYRDTSVQIDQWRIVGVRSALTAPEASSLYRQCAVEGKLDYFGYECERFEGVGTDGRKIAALFFSKEQS